MRVTLGVVLLVVGLTSSAYALDFIKWSDYEIPEGVEALIYQINVKPDNGCNMSERNIYRSELNETIVFSFREYNLESNETCLYWSTTIDNIDGRLSLVSEEGQAPPDPYFHRIEYVPPLVVDLPGRFLQGQVIGDATTVNYTMWDGDVLVKEVEGLVSVRELAVFNDHESLEVPYGTLTDCIKRRDVTKNQIFGQWDKETSVKWFCNGIGVAKEIEINSNGTEKVRELTDIVYE
jgi:hypothetical protein